jgi:hypothetical protein
MTAAIGIRRGGVKPRLAAVAWVIAAVSVAGFAAAWVLAVRNRDLADVTADFGPDRFLVAYAVVGAVVASRRPSNPIGWLLLGIGFVAACRGLAGEYAQHGLAGPSHPGAAVWAAWFVNWSLMLLFPGGLLTFLLLLFPSGRPLTRRWRVVIWLGTGLGVLFLLVNWLTPGALTVTGLPSVPNPTRIQSMIDLSRDSELGNSAWLLSWVFLAAAATSVFIRYRRSAGEERLQLKWFAYAALLSLALLVVLLPVSIVTRSGQILFDAAVAAGIGLALPLAIGIAILRYRLYAIDRIISRTVAYTIVTGLLVGVYTGLVLLATRVLSVHTPVAVAVATLAAAALFNPLRRRVQRAVDRRFNRARYDADQTVAAFAARLKDAIDLDSVCDNLAVVVQQALEPAHMSVWVGSHTSGKPLSGPPSMPR